MKVWDITRRDVRELLDELAIRGPIMANRTLAIIRKMFNFAIERDWIDCQPVSHGQARRSRASAGSCVDRERDSRSLESAR
jgi:hypothetical protein